MKLDRILPLLATLLALAAIGSAQSRYTPPESDSSEVRAVRRLLDPRERNRRPREELVRDLAGLGTRAAPVLVAMATGVLPATDWEKSGLTLEEAGDSVAAEAALLTEALRALPPKATARAVREACGSDAPLDKRLVGLHLLAEIGAGPDAIECWVELAGGVEEIHLRRAYVRAQLETALAQCLARDAGGFSVLARPRKPLERKLLTPVVHACAESAQRAAVDVLCNLRGTDRELDLELLDSLPRLAEQCVGGLDEGRLAWVRAFLRDPEAAVRTRAALALGRLCDSASAPALVEALADEDESVAQAALWSLKHVSRVQLSAGRSGWDAWLQGEGGWWDRERARSLRALESGDSAALVEAFADLARHPLFRHENAAAIAAHCERAEPAVLLAACAALQQLDSLAAADTLALLLGHEDESVRAAAHQALLAISGRKLGPEPEPWQALFGG